MDTTPNSAKAPLAPVAERFVLHWGEMGARWGVNRTVAQIHALLYLAEHPLNAEEIAETLGGGALERQQQPEGVAVVAVGALGPCARRPPRSLICRFDVAHLRRRDAAGKLRFVDITAADFDAADFGRRAGPAEALTDAGQRARIHALRADGRMVVGMAVFRLAWGAAGLGWLLAPTGWPLLRPLADCAYLAFARHRLTLSRRFGGVFAALTPADCGSDACRVR